MKSEYSLTVPESVTVESVLLFETVPSGAAVVLAPSKAYRNH